jgi:hypothetical protein
MISPLVSQALKEFYTGDIKRFETSYIFIEETISKLPKYAVLEASAAAELGTMALAAASVCSELLHDVGREVSVLDIMANAEEADAYSRCPEKSAANLKKVLVQKDEELIKAQKKLGSAKNLYKFLEREYAMLITQHYHCRDIVKGTSSGRSAETFMKSSVDDLL